MSNELKAFVSLYDILQSTLTPEDVAGGCFAKSIISSVDLEEVQAPGSRHTKVAVFLGAVQRAIQLDQATFYTFLDVLSKEAKYTTLVAQLRGKVPGQTTTEAVSPPGDIHYRDIIFTEKDRIGDGGQGAVYKAFWNPKNFNVAIKVLLAISNAGKREIETLRTVRHRNIVQLYGVYENMEGKVCLVLELAQTSLDKHLKQCTPNLETSLDWSMQIGEAMKYLHYGAPTAIVHGDLKSLNVLVHPGNVLKITDFGCAKFQIGNMSTVTRHTLQWCAPELFKNGKHSMESDVYAYGVLLWEIVTHDEPYKGLSDMQIMGKIFQNEHLEVPSKCHEVIKRLMLQCWDVDPKKRPTFKIVMNELESKGAQSYGQAASSSTPRYVPLTSNDLNAVNTRLQAVTNWHYLGENLFVPEYILTSIESNATLEDYSQRRKAMLKWWLDNDHEASWNKLAQSLGGSYVRLGQAILSENCK